MNKDDRTILDAFQDRLEQVENHIIVMNREMGEIAGKLQILIWLMGGTLLVIVGRWIYDIVI